MMERIMMYLDGGNREETGSALELFRAGGCSQAVKAQFWPESPWRAFAHVFCGE